MGHVGWQVGKVVGVEGDEGLARHLHAGLPIKHEHQPATQHADDIQRCSTCSSTTSQVAYHTPRFQHAGTTDRSMPWPGWVAAESAFMLTRYMAKLVPTTGEIRCAVRAFFLHTLKKWVGTACYVTSACWHQVCCPAGWLADGQAGSVTQQGTHHAGLPAHTCDSGVMSA